MNHAHQRAIRVNGHTVNINHRRGRWWAEHWTVWRETNGKYTAVDYRGRAVYYDLPTLEDALIIVAPADDMKAVLGETVQGDGNEA